MAWLPYLAENRSRFLAELCELLRIPSVSGVPAHAGDVHRAAEWVAARLSAAGLEHARVMAVGEHPVIYADWLHAPGKPTVLLYGHFDVQPPDPLEAWTSPPFSPVVRDGRLYARGASDDKGNMVIPIFAAEALLKTTGTLPVNLKFFFEGAEEIDSPQLSSFIAQHADLLACTYVFSADGGQYAEHQPALILGARGICAMEITVEGPKANLHSGVYGGAVQNPIHALVRLLDSMRSPDGRILVAGFYDRVTALTAEERAQFASAPAQEEVFRREAGVAGLFGEPGYTAAERAWARPTLEVNGIWGGFCGPGSQTIIPSRAHAKLTCRLVPSQEPAEILALMEAHIKQHTPLGVRVTMQHSGTGARPYVMPADHPANRAAAAVLRQVYGKEPYLVRTGASIPVCELFQRYLGACTVSFGFGLDDENIHAPDEFFRLINWDRGQEAYCRLFSLLGE